MPLFDYAGADERYYPQLARTVTPGDIGIDLDDDPGDGRWTPTPDTQPEPAKAAAKTSKEG